MSGCSVRINHDPIPRGRGDWSTLGSIFNDHGELAYCIAAGPIWTTLIRLARIDGTRRMLKRNFRGGQAWGRATTRGVAEVSVSHIMASM